MFWANLDRARRAGAGGRCRHLIVGVRALRLLAAAHRLPGAVYRPAPQDAAAMAAELDRMKVPYQLGDDGTTILVAEELVHETRLKLDGQGPAAARRGGLRAVQQHRLRHDRVRAEDQLPARAARRAHAHHPVAGRSADARVHLALPEEGLFKRAQARPRLDHPDPEAGRALRAEQVTGIQRLVARRGAGHRGAGRDHRRRTGVALSGDAGSRVNTMPAPGRLDLKRETEQLLAAQGG